MTSTLLTRGGICILLCLIQFLAALPWLIAVDPGAFRARLRQPSFWLTCLAGVVGAGIVLAIAIDNVMAQERIPHLGRLFSSLLHLQLLADVLMAIFGLLLLVWPKVGAVALAAFREGVRQPIFWLLIGAAILLMAFMPFLPYFTFGEDHLMVKELGFDVVMLLAAIFGAFVASLTIHEEIEGRTAITLMSKPISRRQFLLGKFAGILLTSLVMTGVVGWVFQWVMLYTRWLDNVDPVPPPTELTNLLQSWLPSAEAPGFYLGAGLWFYEAAEVLPGLVLGFCQVMVLVALAVALATRLPMVVNLPICLLVYFLGHLSPILVQVSRPRPGTDASQLPVFKKMVGFVAQVFDTLLPGLQLFTLGPAVITDAPPPLAEIVDYVSRGLLYGVLYTIIVLLFGLVLFEDRDLA